MEWGPICSDKAIFTTKPLMTNWGIDKPWMHPQVLNQDFIWGCLTLGRDWCEDFAMFSSKNHFSNEMKIEDWKETIRSLWWLNCGKLPIRNRNALTKWGLSYWAWNQLTFPNNHCWQCITLLLEASRWIPQGFLFIQIHIIHPILSHPVPSCPILSAQWCRPKFLAIHNSNLPGHAGWIRAATAQDDHAWYELMNGSLGLLGDLELGLLKVSLQAEWSLMFLGVQTLNDMSSFVVLDGLNGLTTTN